MNSFFASIGENLYSQIPQTKPLMPNMIYPPTFSLSSTTVQKVREFIGGLNQGKACGLDVLTARILKDAGEKILEPITHIFNLSITAQTFPDVWKTSLVSPIYKEGSQSSPSNYRPISLMSILSKLLEHIIHEDTTAHLRHIKFNKSQLWLEKGHSTTTCLLSFQSELNDDIASGVVDGVLFLEL